MEQWFIHQTKQNCSQIAACFGISPVTARLLVNRGVRSGTELKEFLAGGDGELPDPAQIADTEKCCGILAEAIRGGRRIRVIGDYDVDGITSTYLYLTLLARAGARVDYVIPDRVQDGYGMQRSMVEKAAADGVSVILTCDTGISAAAETKLAKDLGLTMLITDHHDIPFVPGTNPVQFLLPEADAVVNPKRQDSESPDREICGCMVAFQMMRLLYRQLGRPVQEAEAYLPLAALATVCDVMPLSGTNRRVVARGLREMPEFRNPGLQALIRECLGEDAKLSAYHLGFVIGPCLNATGRLETADQGVRLLSEQEPEQAAVLARALVELNEERKRMTLQGVKEAYALIEREHYDTDPVLVLYLPEVHESLAGIIAGRVREQYNRPSFVLTKSENGIKGSGRSIEAYPMYDRLVECGSLLDRFGGHPMAAGLSLPAENLETLRQQLIAHAGLTDRDFIPKLSIDMELNPAVLDLSVVREMDLLEPFGNANPRPVFAVRGLPVTRASILGAKSNVLKLSLLCPGENGGGPGRYQAVLFGEDRIDAWMKDMTARWGEEAMDELLSGGHPEVCMDLAYTPQVNSFRGRETVELKVVSWR